MRPPAARARAPSAAAECGGSPNPSSREHSRRYAHEVALSSCSPPTLRMPGVPSLRPRRDRSLRSGSAAVDAERPSSSPKTAATGGGGGGGGAGSSGAQSSSSSAALGRSSAWL